MVAKTARFLPKILITKLKMCALTAQMFVVLIYCDSTISNTLPTIAELLIPAALSIEHSDKSLYACDPVFENGSYNISNCQVQKVGIFNHNSSCFKLITLSHTDFNKKTLPL